jgi:uncharacterized membrane protein (UPF0182 family)
MAETLDGALSALLANGTVVAPAPDVSEPPAPDTSAAAALGTTTTSPVPPAIAALVKQAGEHYDRARAAQRSDDWATYGAEMRRLGEVLQQLDATRARRP